MVNASSVLFSILFADDTNLFLQGKNIDELFNVANTELVKVLDWLLANKLHINVSKTNYIIFNPRKKNVKLDSNNIIINGSSILRVDSVKFVGVVLDSKLLWTEHISFIRGKIARGIGIICKARKYFTKSTLLTLYYTFIYHYLTYCVEVWGCTPKIYLSSISKLQKKVIRIITSASFRASTAPLFSNLNILSFEKIYLNCVAVFMYKFDKCMLPDIFNTFYSKNKNIHHYSTRYNEKFTIPLIKTTKLKRTLRYTGACVWNYILDKIDCHCRSVLFKFNLKSFLLDVDLSISDIANV